MTTKDPRAAAALAAPLVAEEHSTYDMRAVLVHITRRARLRMAAGMDHVIEGPEGWVFAAESRDDLGRVTITADIEPGAAAAGGQARSPTAGRACARSPRCATRSTRRWPPPRKSGWDGLAKEQRAYLDEFWENADVELDGDLELQQAVRFSIFHALQAGARAEQRAIAAKGLTGPGYDGHSFWDSESFVLPAAHLHGARRGGRRAAMAMVDAGPRGRARARRCTSTAPPSRGAPSAARSAPATGRRARRRSTSTPASPPR